MTEEITAYLNTQGNPRRKQQGNEEQTQQKRKPPEIDLQRKLLGRFMREMVNVHLVNGYRLTGVLTAFDKFCLEINGRELVYKSAITTVKKAEERNHDQQTSDNL